MTIETDALREQILALMKLPFAIISEYSADPLVLRRVGRVIAQSRGCVFDSAFMLNWLAK